MSSSLDAGVRGTSIFNLNNDAIILVIEAVAALRQHLNSDNNLQNSGLSAEAPPDPLHSFSMTCKYIRALAEPIIFRSVSLHLESNHYSRDGIRKIRVGARRRALAMWWPAAVVYTKHMTITMPAIYWGHNNRRGIPYVDENWEKSMPQLLPVSLQCLLEAPRALRRLHVELPAHIIDHMAGTAMFRPAAPLPHVTDLVVCEYGAFIIGLCRNTTSLGIATNARNTSRVPPIHGEVLDAVLDAAATLPRVSSLSVFTTWTDSAVKAIRARLPNISELRLLHPRSKPRPEVVGLILYASRFPSLRTIGMSRIQGLVLRLSSGELVWNYDKDCPAGLDDFLCTESEAEEEVAIGLLHSEHPTLERVEINSSWGEKGGVIVYAYAKDEGRYMTKDVRVVEKLKAEETSAYWQE